MTAPPYNLAVSGNASIIPSYYQHKLQLVSCAYELHLDMALSLKPVPGKTDLQYAGRGIQGGLQTQLQKCLYRSASGKR